MKKVLISVLALAVAVSLSIVGLTGVAVANEYDSSLILENKDGDWNAMTGDDIQATLEYNSAGPKFEYRLTAKGLESGVDYSLIYYADKADRFVDWGGDNPGALIGTGSPNDGGLTMSGSVELDMHLPCLPDANICLYDYTEEYGTAHGAKIWLVPSKCYVEGKVTSWVPSRFLFETGLIVYTDTDLGSPAWACANVPVVVRISVDPTFWDFGTVFPGENSKSIGVTVTNTGSVPIHVTTQLNPPGTVFDTCLHFPASGGSITTFAIDLAGGANYAKDAQLRVPRAYAAQGVETATIIFWAVAQ